MKKGLENYLTSLKYAELSGDKLRILTALINTANVYNKPATQEKAKEYYLKAFTLAESSGDINSLSSIAVELGLVYNDLNDTTKAMFYYTKALVAGGDSSYTYLNIGKLYTDEGKYDLALRTGNSFRYSEKK